MINDYNLSGFLVHPRNHLKIKIRAHVLYKHSQNELFIVCTKPEHSYCIQTFPILNQAVSQKKATLTLGPVTTSRIHDIST